MTKQVYMKLQEGGIIQTDSPQYWKEAERMTAKDGLAAYQEQARQKLLKFFKPGDTAHTQLLHVSSSGMSRRIAVIGTQREERTNAEGKKETQWVPVNLSGAVADLLGYKLDKSNSGLVVGGCGMDMGFHVVYAMASRMWPNGTDKPHGRRNGEPDSSGGYAIKHRWL